MGAVTAVVVAKGAQFVFKHAATFLVAVLLCSCGDDQCLWYKYGPAPARIKVRATDTGEFICKPLVSTNRGSPVFREDDCEFLIPEWYPKDDAGSTVTINVEGYFEEEVTFPVERDECGAIKRPPVQEIEVEVDPDYES